MCIVSSDKAGVPAWRVQCARNGRLGQGQWEAVSVTSDVRGILGHKEAI